MKELGKKVVNFIRDQAWQFIGVVVAIFLFYLATSSQNKSLSYQIISDTSLVNKTSGSIETRIQVLFDQKKVTDPHIVLVKIINSGNVSISSGDFERALSLTFGENVRVLDATIVDQFPKDLQPSQRVEEEIITGTNELKSQSIKIDRLLLNPGDYLTVGVLLDGYKGDFSANARINGVKEIKNTTDNQTSTNADQAVNLYLVFFVTSTILLIALYPLGGIKIIRNIASWYRSSP